MLDNTSTSKYNEGMKTDNTISIIGKIKDAANHIIVKELEARGYLGLAPSHGDILSLLIIKGEMTKTEIAQSINRERSTVTTLIKKLEKLEYIESRVNEEDARSIIVSLTEKGHQMKVDFIEISELLYQRQFKGMTKKQIETFRQGLLKVHQNFLDK